MEDAREPDAGPAVSDAETRSDAAAPDPGTPLDLEVVTTELAEVTAALERLDAGRYGRCGTCGGAIDDETLGSSPTARSCAAHLPM